MLFEWWHIIYVLIVLTAILMATFSVMFRYHRGHRQFNHIPRTILIITFVGLLLIIPPIGITVVGILLWSLVITGAPSVAVATASILIVATWSISVLLAFGPSLGGTDNTPT